MSAGYLLASFVLPLTFYRFDKLLHIAFGNMGLVVVMSVTPWCFYYGIMLTMHLLKGFMCGISELGKIEIYMLCLAVCFKLFQNSMYYKYNQKQN